ncbi:AAA family ATPase [Anaerosalibacter sp. Marseille-P3206]|uniref:AAA family ATPase n=1 Tax=Anaerosalibacter sp. Marseille-P3206 TaxID=1871005 RepID=UPI000987ACA6|nr:ATP-binding protein [Anaerosalibacter sp. Marseille-P3206]
MLVRFILENFLSYKERTEFAMIPGNVRRMKDHLIDSGDINVLRCGTVYGANASGKSNLVKAIKFSSDIIVKGIENVDATNKHFRLDDLSANKPSIFEYEISIENKIYSYGYATTLSNKEIIEEWLYLKKSNGEECIFDRECLHGETKIETDIKFKDKESKTRFGVYMKDIERMPKTLFLTEIANKNIKSKELDIFKQVYDWFKNKLVVIFPTSKFLGVNRIPTDSRIKEQFSEYLEYFDTGITNVEIKEIDSNRFLKQLPDDLKLEFNNMERNKSTVLIIENKIFSIEKDNKGQIIISRIGIEHNYSKDLFDLEDESDGTVRLFDLIPLLALIPKDKVVFIDEIDRSFHPKLTVEFIKLFYKLSLRTKAQLIVTTHESHLLDLNLFRRDEIWFVERNKEGSSEIYSLDIFKDRYDKKIEKDYLIGRYGAIPIFEHLNSIDCGGNKNGKAENTDKIQ